MQADKREVRVGKQHIRQRDVEALDGLGKHLENRFGDQVLREDNRGRTETGSQKSGLRNWVEIVVIHRNRKYKRKSIFGGIRLLVLGKLRLRCLWDGQADRNLDMRRKARDMELRVGTINSGGWCHGLIQGQSGMGGGGGRMEW